MADALRDELAKLIDLAGNADVGSQALLLIDRLGHRGMVR